MRFSAATASGSTEPVILTGSPFFGIPLLVIGFVDACLPTGNLSAFSHPARTQSVSTSAADPRPIFLICHLRTAHRALWNRPISGEWSFLSGKVLSGRSLLGR